MTQPEYQAQTGRSDPVFSKRVALVWATFGAAVAAAAMVYTGMPQGDRRDLLVLLIIMTAAAGVGGLVTGYRDTKAQSVRNVIALALGATASVAVVVLVDVVSSAGMGLEMFGEASGMVFFGTMVLGGVVALVGAVFGYLGLRLGRLLGGRSTSKEDPGKP